MELSSKPDESSTLRKNLDVNESFPDPISLNFHLPALKQNLDSQLIANYLENLSFSLSESQQSQLENLGKSGVQCLLNLWFPNSTESKDSYCNGTWDSVYCWPPSKNGSVALRSCSEILQARDPNVAPHIKGNAIRICQGNGTWLWGNWTNYTDCADLYEEYVGNAEEEKGLVVLVQHVLFFGFILSVICLATSLFIFNYFKCLWCDRVRVYTHLMAALLLRCAFLIVLTEPFIFNRTSHYRNVDIICKAVLSINLYSTVASINWMFVQGLYLHGKLTTNVFDSKPPFKLYYFVGWILPLLLVIVYATTVETLHPVKCWKDYSERTEIWILLGPMIIALLANLLFLINIMRIMLTKVQLPNSSSDSSQLRRAVKVTFVLLPLLGITNLLFLYNPGGKFNKFFVIMNTGFGSTQGIFVSILYCFVSKDVRNAIHRRFHRFTVRRNVNLSRRGRGIGSLSMISKLPTAFQANANNTDEPIDRNFTETQAFELDARNVE